MCERVLICDRFHSKVIMVTVTTKLGALRGIEEKTETDFEFVSFLGVPYAQPPIGELRFKDTRPVKPWDGVLDATQSGSDSLHTDIFLGHTSGSEDCLYLNIYTPKSALNGESSSKPPVMVFFHGGAYICGSGRREFYGPELLIDKNIVLVTINYRFGCLGFLRLEDETLGVLGNAGLKDQTMALRWVQENISAFGGNAENVTIFGQSSGAASVCYQMVSPMAQGLFHKAIMQSGVANCVWAQGNRNSAYDLIKVLDQKAKDDKDILKILQALPVEKLIEAQHKVPDTWELNSKRVFGPVIEHHSQIENIFLPDFPQKLIETGNYHKVPIILGGTSGEGQLTKILETIQGVNYTPENDEGFVPYTFQLDKTSEKCREIGAKIREYYYGEQEPCYSPKAMLCRYYTDVAYMYPILDTAKYIMKTSEEKIYMYQFCLKTRLNVLANMPGACGRDVSHTDDLYYLFRTDLTKKIKPNKVEETGIQRLTTWWTNFAKHGNPNSLDNKGLELFSEKWIDANSEDMQYMEINENIKMKKNFNKKNYDFWKNLENEIK